MPETEERGRLSASFQIAPERAVVRIDPPRRRRVYSSMLVHRWVGRLDNLCSSHQLAAIADKLVRMYTADTNKDRLAAVVEQQWIDFQDRLSDPGKRYPIQEFKAFVQAVRNYVACTEKDLLIHRKVVNVMNGLRDGIERSRKQVPGEVLAEADRLECLFFAGYDPYFEGNEPPGL